jgi:GTP cyclohydrolase IA
VEALVPTAQVVGRSMNDGDVPSWMPQAIGKILRTFTRTAVLPEGMTETPDRVLRALAEMTAGYSQDPATILSKTFDADGYDEIVVLRDIPFNSLCEHHVLPFVGTAGVAYLPGARVVGLSKLARVVDVYARRFQIQERMTQQIADAVSVALNPRGVAVLVKGRHLCMEVRGVKKTGAEMVTSVVRGVFMEKPQARAEVLDLLGART